MATTTGAVLATGEGNPALGSTATDAPGLGVVYARSIPVPGDAAAVTLEVPADPSSQANEFWTIAVTCRVGCDDAGALRIAEALAVSIAPRAPELFKPQPAGTRYWAPGAPLAASASEGTVPVQAQLPPSP